MSGERRIGCSRGKGSARHGPKGVGGDTLRETSWKPRRRASCLASLSVRPCLKRGTAILNSYLYMGVPWKMILCSCTVCTNSFVQVWSGEARRGQCAMILQYFTECPNLQQFWYRRWVGM